MLLGITQRTEEFTSGDKIICMNGLKRLPEMLFPIRIIILICIFSIMRNRKF